MKKYKVLGGIIAFLICSSHLILAEPQGNQAGLADTLGPQYTPYAYQGRNYEQNMRNFIIRLANYAHQFNEDFLIIPQNGQSLLTDNLEPTGKVVQEYASVLSGQGREDLNYGYEGDDLPTQKTSPEAYKRMVQFLELAEANGIEVLVTDYANTPSHVIEAYRINKQHQWVTIVQNRPLDSIPLQLDAPYEENLFDVYTLQEAKNFLYWINPAPLNSFLKQLQNTNYDSLIIDLFVHGTPLTSQQVASLKLKKNGGKRLVIAYMSIGEAENYRWYWQDQWNITPPEWLGEENPYWPGNFKVRYWNPDWQQLFYGNEQSYLKQIIDAGFDGVYLDIVDAYEYYKGKRGDWD